MENAQRASMQHRLKRRTLWVSLWLARLVACSQHFCGAPKSGLWRDWFDVALDRLARCAMAIMLCDAALRVELRKPRGFNDPRKSHVISLRATYGSAMRRAFRARDFANRLRKIQRALDESEILIARLVRRLRRGMTRYAFAHTRAPIVRDIGIRFAARAALFPTGGAAAIRSADTS